MELTLAHLIMALLSAFLVGVSKSGMPGLGVLLVPLMAAAVGATNSPGVLLPIILAADVIAVVRYRKHAEWRLILGLLPWVIPGLYLGTRLLAHLAGTGADGMMKTILGAMVLALVAFQLVKSYLGEWIEQKLPHTWWFSALMGILAGLATGLAHLAGPVMTVYFLSKNLKKHSFVGSAAIFFFIVNLAKLPLYIPQGALTMEHFVLSLKLVAAVPVGAVVGFILFRLIPQKPFNAVVLALAALAAVKLLLP